MSLTSLYYLIYLTVIVTLYYTLKHKYRIYLLLAASLVFYYVNQSWYVVFLCSAIVVNYAICALWIRFRKTWLIYSAVTYNILILAFFKYIPIILFGHNIPEDSIWARLILPIGISFYSFQAIGYVLDLYWTDANHQTPLTHFSLYMSFFPQLMAGPVARAARFIPQIGIRTGFDDGEFVVGSRRLLFGLFKKLVIANNLAPYTDAVFNNVEMHHGLTFILAAVLFTIQVYADFSGYSDIAIGSAHILGFKLIENFRAPFLATSITEFWRRWHISLSSWVRDYVHFPIQFKTRTWGRLGVITATLATFLIIGVWHGAYWSFLIFGLIMGIAITFEECTKNFRRKLTDRLPAKLVVIVSTFLVFAFMSASMILLKGNSLRDIGIIVRRASFNLDKLYIGSGSALLSAVMGFIVISYLEFRLREVSIDDIFLKLKPILRWSYYIVLIVLILGIGELDNEAFIYYQF